MSYENFKPFETQDGQLHIEEREDLHEAAKDKRLGKAPAKSSPKQLHLATYAKKKAPAVPATFDFWKGKKPFPFYDMGNNEFGDCGIASQAEGQMRMERLEQNRTIEIPRDNILKAYFDLTAREYGGGDTGIYETDGLDQWRKPDLTFRDSKGRPCTIDAYVRVNQANIEEFKLALFLSAAHGLKLCFNLPIAWQQTDDWDLPEGQKMTGSWVPGSWGGHSMWVDATWRKGDILTLPSTWNQAAGTVTTRGITGFADECHLVIDSVNSWKKKKQVTDRIDLDALKSDVNQVSSQKIK